ncbi:MAG TPA: hypothetical protein VL021_09710 [Brumimicrobium sp.]|nr:hypothetical protein [Brumimicrobium sp.]
MEDIQLVITEIEAKVGKMRNALNNVKVENSALKSEVERLSDKLLEREQEATDFKNKYDDLMHKFENSQVVITNDSSDNDAQIDALVREIDECISRLKAE